MDIKRGDDLHNKGPAVSRENDSSNRPAGHGWIADIELLRGFAILFVLIEHVRFSLIPWFSGQTSALYIYFGFWTGVDLFFAISGFVIARSLLPLLEATKGPTEFFNATLSFWVRRAWRLLPSAWLWIAVILIAVIAFNRSGAFGSFRAAYESAIAGILNLANFRVLLVYGRHEAGAAFPYWSLSLEEQFYLLFPLIVFFARRYLPQVLAVAVLAQLFVARSGIGTSDFGAVLNMIRSDALLFGVLIALWSRHSSYRLFEPVGLKRSWLARVVLPVFMLFLLAAASAESLHLVSFRIGVVAVLSAGLVLIASYDGGYLFPDVLFKRLMIWMGSRSYGLYLIHIPAYLATREIWYRIDPATLTPHAGHAIRLILTAAVLLAGLAEFNYRFVELPLRRRGARIAERLRQRTGGAISDLGDRRYA